MLFEEKHYGKPISELLSKHLIDHTQDKDFLGVASDKVSKSTVRKVVYRERVLSTDNSTAIIDLMKIAVRNCMLKIKEGNKASKVKKELNTMLEK